MDPGTLPLGLAAKTMPVDESTTELASFVVGPGGNPMLLDQHA